MQFMETTTCQYELLSQLFEATRTLKIEWGLSLQGDGWYFYLVDRNVGAVQGLIETNATEQATAKLKGLCDD